MMIHHFLFSLGHTALPLVVARYCGLSPPSSPSPFRTRLQNTDALGAPLVTRGYVTSRDVAEGVAEHDVHRVRPHEVPRRRTPAQHPLVVVLVVTILATKLLGE